MKKVLQGMKEKLQQNAEIAASDAMIYALKIVKMEWTVIMKQSRNKGHLLQRRWKVWSDFVMYCIEVCTAVKSAC